MLGKWEPWYATATTSEPYGSDASYLAAAEWLDGLAVEDWGCGLGYFRKFCRHSYVGIDGSASPFVDVIADLRNYRSTTPGLLLRHVLEHNQDWPLVLDNAVASFTHRMAVVLFTPLQPSTTVLATDVGGLGVPDIGFRLEDLLERLNGCYLHTLTSLRSQTAYGGETVLLIGR